jgi:hypothetical protein
MLLLLLPASSMSAAAQPRQALPFDYNWRFKRGDPAGVRGPALVCTQRRVIVSEHRTSAHPHTHSFQHQWHVRFECAVADCSRLHIMFTLAFQCCAPLCVVFVAYSRLHVMLTVCLRLRLRVESLGSCGSVKCRICSHSSGHPIDPLVGVSVSDIMFALAFVFENTRGAR